MQRLFQRYRARGVSPRGAYPSRFTPMPLTGQALSEANGRPEK